MPEAMERLLLQRFIYETRMSFSAEMYQFVTEASLPLSESMKMKWQNLINYSQNSEMRSLRGGMERPHNFGVSV